MAEHDRLFVGGVWAPPSTDAVIEVVSPHTEQVARQVRTGSFGVNQPCSMDPTAPFGGMKASGIGRELGPEGLDRYLELKAISVAANQGD